MQLQRTRCKKCEYEWIPRVENPMKCPRCGHIRDSKIYETKKAKGG